MPTSITTIQATDVIANSRTDINNNFASLNTNKIETSYIDTDTSLTANSDVKIPSQKAVKAYVDSGGQQNASEIIRGLVEEATDAEVTAGTATGGTGAKLFITPTKLATYLPNATLVKKVAINTTEVSVTDGGASHAEQTLFSVSIPANTLSTNNAVRFYVYLSNLGIYSTSENARFYLKYGGSTLATLTYTNKSQVTGMTGELTGYLVADGATNAQKGILRLEASATSTELATDASVGITKVMGWANGSSTEDSTGALNLVVSVDYGSTNAANDLTAEFIIVEKIA